MKILEPNLVTDKMAILVVDDKLKLLDMTGATEAEVEKFVTDNIRRYVPCDILGYFERSPEETAVKKAAKPKAKKAKDDDDDAIGELDNDAQESTEGDADATASAPNKFPRPKPVAQPRVYD